MDSPSDAPPPDEARGLRIVRGKQSGIAASIREGRRRRALRERAAATDDATSEAEDRAAVE